MDTIPRGSQGGHGASWRELQSWGPGAAELWVPMMLGLSRHIEYLGVGGCCGSPQCWVSAEVLSTQGKVGAVGPHNAGSQQRY